MRQLIGRAVLVGTALAAAVMTAAAQGPSNFSTALISYQEVPAVSSPAVGSISIRIDDAAQTIAYRLSFSGLEGAVIQSHIHIGQSGVNGGVMVFLCGTGASPGPAGTSCARPAAR